MSQVDQKEEIDLKIKQANLLLSRAIDETSQLISITNEENHFIFVNKSFLSTYGYTSEEIIGKHPQLLKSINCKGPTTLEIFDQTRKGKWSGELLNVCKDGTELPIMLKTSVIRDDYGKLVGYIGIAEVITERKEAEEALRESELRFRTTVEMAPDAIFIADTSGSIIDVNEAACHQLNYNREQLLRKKLFDIMPAHYAQKASARLKELKDADHTYESCHLKSDGSEIAVELNIKKIIYRGKPAMLGIARDISERKLVESKLRDFTRQIIEVQENERGRVARELHDSVIQLLSASKHRISAVREKMNVPDEKVSEDLLVSLNLLDKAIKETRTISHGLKPSILEDLGLLPAIRSISEDLMQRCPIKINIQNTMSYKRLPHDIELVLYRIVQEALNNIEKHSHAMEAEIELIYNDPSLELSIRDNGVGFHYDSTLINHSLLSGYGLVNMKERAASVGGVVEINSIINQGTEIIVSIPQIIFNV